jgi:hypothetical protein
MRYQLQLLAFAALVLGAGCATTQSDDPYAQTKRGAAIGAAIGAAAGFFVGDGYVVVNGLNGIQKNFSRFRQGITDL